MKHTFTLLFLALALTVSGQEYQVVTAFPNLPTFAKAIDLQYASDGSNRLFVAQQGGLIYQFNNSPTVSARKVFLDLTDAVSLPNGETGLLGLAFHPQFAENGYIFVNYTHPVQAGTNTLHPTRISRFQATGANRDTVLRSSEVIFMEVYQPYPNHKGGWIGFGPDGYLYTSLGDGGSGGDPQNRAQNKDSLLGKILRIDINTGSNTYAIPPSNPFVGTAGRDEIYAYGLRNAWRCSFDPVTKKLWAGDVGQQKYEEIDTITKGGNYGWRVKEGYHCYNPSSGCDSTGFQSPVWEYEHANGDLSVTGGYVYRGQLSPGLTGKYLFADYGSGRIWAMTYEGRSLPLTEELFDLTTTVSSFGVDANNELYILGYGNGRIHKIVQTAEVSKEDQISETLTIYPNPAYEVVHITAGIEGKGNASIMDVNGKEIRVFDVDDLLFGKDIEVKDLPDGVYWILVRSEDVLLKNKFIIIR